MSTVERLATLLFALSALSGPGGPAASPEVAALRTQAEKLRPLHERKHPPQPGEWLDKHREAGQSFDAYLASRPNRPDARHKILYVQPLGRPNPVEQKLMDATSDLLGRFFNVPVTVLPALGLDVIPAEARRVHPEWNVRQILSTHVLRMLETRRPDDALAVIALTTADLWPGEGWNFVFGQASLQNRVGVWSTARLGDPNTEYDLVLLRTLKTALHETGHMLGIPHCTKYECGMNGSNHLPESDSQPLWFCPDDECKLWWACRDEPGPRYARLAAFADAHGMKAEADFWRRSAQAVAASKPVESTRAKRP
ncbi:MAG: archaemetzincin [Isosphaeraceae bacterium]